MLSPARSRWLRVAGPPLAAAVLGNAFVGKDALRWYRELRQPALQVPLPAFAAVGGVYYLLMGVVLHRAETTRDPVLRRRTYAVLVGNELWNAAFFGGRSTRNGFLGLVAFTVPVLALQARASPDPWARRAAAPYTLWVLLYDLPWTYRLWQLDRGGSGLSPPRWSPRHGRRG